MFGQKNVSYKTKTDMSTCSTYLVLLLHLIWFGKFINWIKQNHKIKTKTNGINKRHYVKLRHHCHVKGKMKTKKKNQRNKFKKKTKQRENR